MGSSFFMGIKFQFFRMKRALRTQNSQRNLKKNKVRGLILQWF